MEFWTVTLISLAAGVVIVIGGALVWYMGSLVKSAYQLKIDMKADMEAGRKRIEDDVEKKMRLIKRDIVDEVEKIKTALQTDAQRRMNEIADTLGKRLTEVIEEWRVQQDETAKLLEGLRHDITVLDQRQRNLRREQKPVAIEKPLAGEQPPAMGDAEAEATPTAPPSASSPPDAAAAAAPFPAPAEPPSPAVAEAGL